MSGRHLVLAGGGHAHLELLHRLKAFIGRGCRVTIISPDSYHYYSGMGPGLLGNQYQAEEIRFDIRKIATERGGTFLADAVIGIRPDQRSLELASGRKLAYDFASFNLGSEVPREPGFEADARLITVKPIVNLERARQRLLAEPTQRILQLVVAGGGPAGSEIAGNLRRLTDRQNRKCQVTLVAGRELLAGYPRRLRKQVLQDFASRGIIVREGCRLTGFSAGQADLDDDTSLPADFLFLAVGVRPPTLFRKAGLHVGAEGGMLVNRCLQSVDYPELFGGGDCICFAEKPLDKVGVHAVRQGPVLAENLLAALDGKPLRAYQPQKHYLLIFNLGSGRGVLHWRGLVLGGRWIFRLKDWIDRRFMRGNR